MQAVGIICEYNPLHLGHAWQISETRRLTGEDTAIVCAMSGNFVQRGEAAIVRKHVRARAAIESGADLVLELPLPWSVSSAERFAYGGVSLLQATGAVSAISFGSESGDLSLLRSAAECMETEAYREALRRHLERGVTYASAAQSAAQELGCTGAALLSEPNNTLAVEYLRAIARCGDLLKPICVLRRGARHDGAEADGIASASAIRQKLLSGADADLWMTPAMANLYREEAKLGRAPISLQPAERAILARLRSMTKEEMSLYDEGKEGLSNRIFNAVRSGATAEDILEKAKTKRYPRARLCRTLLWMYLGMIPSEMPCEVPYLRVLACNERGREVLNRMRKTATAPVLVKPADVRNLHPQAQQVFALEAKATDLYTLCYPALSQAIPGSEWKENPVIL
ncbi:MAG: nucleotidyltransferase family protein [Oscillospiraceae bacterium]|nr:nucleotidyltransferase family protein [Oscillospiraceae bacterium]